MKIYQRLIPLLALLCICYSNLSWSHGHGGGHGGGYGGGHFGGGHFGGYRGGYYGGYGGYYGGAGLGAYYGLGYPYGNGNPYYYPPSVITTAPATNQVYIQQAPINQQTVPIATQPAPPPPPVAQSNASSYWYYCKSSKGYYPYVKSCKEDWQQVSPVPPPK